MDKVSEFYNRSMKSWLQDNHVVSYSIRDFNGGEIVETFDKK